MMKPKLNTALLTRLGVFFLCAFMTALAPILLYQWLFKGNALLLETLFVSESAHIKASEINAYLAKYIGQPILGLDLLDLETDILKHPWVKSVQVRRALPHALVIDPLERKALFYVDFRKKRQLIDEDGLAFMYADAEALQALPVAHGAWSQEQLKNAASLINAQTDLMLTEKYPVAEIQVDGADGLHIRLKDGLLANFGSGNFPQKWQKLDKILTAVSHQDRQLLSVYLGDYPFLGHVPVRFKR